MEMLGNNFVSIFRCLVCCREKHVFPQMHSRKIDQSLIDIVIELHVLEVCKFTYLHIILV